MEQAVALARIALVEDIADIYVDVADDGPGRFQRGIVRHVRGSRYLDAGVFLVGEFRRKAGLGDRRDENRERKQPAAGGQSHPGTRSTKRRYPSRRCECAEPAECR